MDIQMKKKQEKIQTVVEVGIEIEGQRGREVNEEKNIRLKHHFKARHYVF